MRSLAFLVVTSAAFAPASEARVLLYPTAVKTLPSQFSSERWHLSDPAQLAKYADGVKFDKTVGGPFAADEPAWHVLSDKPQPGYWLDRVKLAPGHRYLVGTWVRFPNAKILLEFNGKDADTKRYWDHRLYYFAGFNSQLKPYFNDRLMAKLSDDPNVWKLMYTVFTAPKLMGETANVFFGLYLAAGDMTFSHPFLIDITDSAPTTLELEILDSKPVRALTLSELDTRDVRWQKRFDAPVTNWKATLPADLDAFRNLAARRPKGHQLRIDYADGSSELVTAPLENAFH